MPNFIEEQREAQVKALSEEKPPTKKKKRVKLKHLVCNATSRKLYFVIFFAVSMPTLIYFYVFDYGHFPEDSRFSCLADEKFKVPCGKVNITQEECLTVNCCFNLTSHVCYHYLPSMYYYEKQSNGSYTTDRKISPFNSSSVKNVKITIYENTEDIFSIILHEASEEIEAKNISRKNYDIDISENPLAVEVKDKDNDTVLSTIYGPLIASEFYWEWTLLLTNETLFGLDRNAINISKNETLTKVIYKNNDDHVTLPVFWAYQNKKFYGMAVKHDGPLEITILPSNLIILKSIAGEKIELQMFLGPTPADLHKKMAGEIVTPPLWALGTHICRRSSDTDLDKLLEDYSSDSLTQFDTDCIHENIFFSISNTTQAEDLKNFTEVLDGILANGTRFLLNVPPQILANESSLLYNTSKSLGILLQFNNTDYQGKYLNKKVVYPDYFHSSISDYTKILMDYISKKIGLDKISGLILNDNWPEDDSYQEVNGSELPYFSESLQKAMAYTLPWNVTLPTNQNLQMIHHNSYGTLQNQSIYKYLQTLESNRDLLIISATKNYGDLEPAIVENFNTSWENFQVYLQRTLFNSITGNHLVGLPVCGDTNFFDQTLQETLCLRWYLAASTMPYFRISSVKPFRDPESLDSKFATRYALMAIERRKLLQEHYYTILSRGEPIVRPMYYDYYENTTTFYMTSQYTIGSNMVVAHPMSSSRTKLQVYLPKKVGVWYEFWGGILYNTTDKANQYVNISVVETDWVSFVGQGSIIPLTRNLELNLTIALNCQKNPCEAHGELYKNENYLQFSADNTKITISNLPESCEYTINYINLYQYNGTESFQESIFKNVTICSENLRNENSTEIFYEKSEDSTEKVYFM